MKYSATIEIYGKPAEQTMELATDFIKENKEVSIEQAVNLVVWQGYKEYLDFLSILKHYPRNENIYAKIHGDSIQIIPNYSLNDFHKNIIHLFDQFFKQHITESTHNDIMNAIKIILGLNKKATEEPPQSIEHLISHLRELPQEKQQELTPVIEHLIKAVDK